jgi:transcriptional regulator
MIATFESFTMYIPDAFHETDPDQLCAFVARNSFGMLVSQVDGEPFVTHLPFLLQRQDGRLVALVGHVARANPQWQGLEGQPALAVFPGPHAYISPAWYEAENVVPTWNYVAVHVYGTVRLIESPEALTDLVQQFVTVYEANRPQPWQFNADSEFAQRLVRLIVGFRIEVSRIEGKWKLNQNHAPERRERVAQALFQSDDPNAKEIARLMQESLEKRDAFVPRSQALPGNALS